MKTETVNRSAEEHVCVTQRCRQQCEDGQREGWGTWGWVKVGKGEEMGKSVIVSTVKIKLNK